MWGWWAILARETKRKSNRPKRLWSHIKKNIRTKMTFSHFNLPFATPPFFRASSCSNTLTDRNHHLFSHSSPIGRARRPHRFAPCSSRASSRRDRSLAAYPGCPATPALCSPFCSAANWRNWLGLLRRQHRPASVCHPSVASAHEKLRNQEIIQVCRRIYCRQLDADTYRCTRHSFPGWRRCSHRRLAPRLALALHENLLLCS